MGSRRRPSCPVSRREVIRLENFDINNKETFDGTETLRGLNKFDGKWFRENAVALTMTSKGLLGKTFVVAYKDIDNKRYWIIDPIREAENKAKIEKYGDKAVL